MYQQVTHSAAEGSEKCELSSSQLSAPLYFRSYSVIKWVPEDMSPINLIFLPALPYAVSSREEQEAFSVAVMSCPYVAHSKISHSPVNWCAFHSSNNRLLCHLFCYFPEQKQLRPRFRLRPRPFAMLKSEEFVFARFPDCWKSTSLWKYAASQDNISFRTPLNNGRLFLPFYCWVLLIFRSIDFMAVYQYVSQ